MPSTPSAASRWTASWDGLTCSPPNGSKAVSSTRVIAELLEGEEVDDGDVADPQRDRGRDLGADHGVVAREPQQSHWDDVEVRRHRRAERAAVAGQHAHGEHQCGVAVEV